MPKLTGISGLAALVEDSDSWWREREDLLDGFNAETASDDEKALVRFAEKYDGRFRFNADVNDQGEVTAKVAELGVVDRRLEIIDEQAVAGVHPVVISDWGHSSALPYWMGSSRRPVGDGGVVAEKRNLMLAGQLFMEMQAGQDAFAYLKARRERGNTQEWSIHYWYGAEPVSESRRVKDRVRTVWRHTKVDVDETSPVLRGVSFRTGTRGLKSDSGVPLTQAVAHDLQRLNEFRLRWRSHITLGGEYGHGRAAAEAH